MKIILIIWMLIALILSWISGYLHGLCDIEKDRKERDKIYYHDGWVWRHKKFDPPPIIPPKEEE